MDDVSKRSGRGGGDLSLFLDPEKMTRRIWVGSELAAILKHQLETPVGFDLGAGAKTAAAEPEAADRELPQWSESFARLFGSSRPSLRLLILTKDFAKRQLHRVESPLPREIARVLYLASIAVSKVKCRTTITTLAVARLLEGFEWGREQPWMDARIRDIFKNGWEAFRLSTEPEAGGPDGTRG